MKFETLSHSFTSFDELVELESLIYRTSEHYDEKPWNRHNFRKELPEKFQRSLVCFDDMKKIIGFLIAYKSSHSNVHISRLAVAPNVQGRGIASRMLSCLISESEDGIVQTLTVDVQSENGQALDLYRKFGFTMFEGIELECYVVNRARSRVSYIDTKKYKALKLEL